MNWHRLRHVSAAFGTGIPSGVVLALAVETAFPMWTAVVLGVLFGWGVTEERLKEDK